MTKKGLLFFTFILLVCSMQAQIDSLCNKPYHDKIQLLYKYYSSNRKCTSKDSLLKRIKAVKEYAEKHDDKELVLESEFMQALAYGYDLYNQPKKSIEAFEALIDKVKSHNYEIILPKIYRRIGELYWNRIDNYELAFENYYKMLEAQKQYTNHECPDIGLNYATIGEAYFFFKDYSLCKKYMQDCIACSPHIFSDKSKNKARNAIGLCYQEEGKIDSANLFFYKILESTEDFKLPEWKGIAKGNLAYSHMLRKQYEKAIPLFKENIRASLEAQDSSLVSACYSKLGICYIEVGDRANADTCIQKAEFYTRRVNEYSRYKDFYKACSYRYMANGNHAFAKIYMDSTLLVIDSLDKIYSANQILRVNQKFEHNKRLALLTEKEAKTTQRNFVLALLFLGALVSIYAYLMQRKSFKQKMLIDEMKLLKVSEELNNTTQQLHLFANSISEKTALLEELETKLIGQVNDEVLFQLKEHAILTDEDWDTFRKLFEKVHKGYLIRLKSKLPDLSPSEVRFMTLAKLKLSNKEMAAMLGLSPQSLRVTKHRLIKKLNLNQEGGLENLVESI